MDSGILNLGCLVCLGHRGFITCLGVHFNNSKVQAFCSGENLHWRMLTLSIVSDPFPIHAAAGAPLRGGRVWDTAGCWVMRIRLGKECLIFFFLKSKRTYSLPLFLCPCSVFLFTQLSLLSSRTHGREWAGNFLGSNPGFDFWLTEA